MTKDFEEKIEDEIDVEMETGEIDEDVYSEEGRENLVEDDEISVAEEGFMQGAEGDGQDAKCANCGKILMEIEDVVEKEIDGEVKKFCSDKCAEDYEKDHS